MRWLDPHGVRPAEIIGGEGMPRQSPAIGRCRRGGLANHSWLNEVCIRGAPGVPPSRVQPFTPVTECLRALLTGAPVGNTASLALAWCAAIALVGYVLALVAYRRGTPR
jgi:hypothetical protein